jgi:hypothetical protein
MDSHVVEANMHGGVTYGSVLANILRERGNVCQSWGQKISLL